jgi:hypothetical protein
MVLLMVKLHDLLRDNGLESLKSELSAHQRVLEIRAYIVGVRKRRECMSLGHGDGFEDGVKR